MSVLFIFRRDLRIEDNLALNKAIEYSNNNNLNLILAFAFNDEQINSNSYFSNNSFQFMLECLTDLNKDVSQKLSFFENNDFYKTINNLKAIAFNVDYTPYARKRDTEIINFCKKQQHPIKVITSEDYTLHGIDTIKTLEKKPYEMFTPFYKNCLKYHSVSKPSTTIIQLNKVIKVGSLKDLDKYISKSQKDIVGSRKKALNILKLIKKGVFDNYKTNRDLINHPNSTTRLSAYLKFGCISIREAYYAIKSKYGKNTDLIRQLYWKEFYANITYHFSYVLNGMLKNKSNKSFKTKYDDIEWNNDYDNFKKWCNGETGFPIVDAGMNQLNKTGFMHNRLRMITASFLIKDLGIDWREGEKYFASKLIDYDPASNNGGWQWVAGTGTDASPYFRVFNPWRQSKEFDPDCKYIHYWVKDLKTIKPNHIHTWYDDDIRKLYPDTKYFEPIVNHDVRKKLILKKYEKAA